MDTDPSVIFHQDVSAPLVLHSRLQTDFRSYEDLGEGIGPGAADVALGRVERHVVDRLLELLTVGGELLDARFALHVPQADGAVMTWRDRQKRFNHKYESDHKRTDGHLISGLNLF